MHRAEVSCPRTPRQWRSRARYLGAVPSAVAFERHRRGHRAEVSCPRSPRRDIVPVNAAAMASADAIPRRGIAEGIAPRCRARDHRAEVSCPRTPRRWRSRTRYLGAVPSAMAFAGTMPRRGALDDGARGHDTSMRCHRRWRSRPARYLGATPSAMAFAGTDLALCAASPCSVRSSRCALSPRPPLPPRPEGSSRRALPLLARCGRPGVRCLSPPSTFLVVRAASAVLAARTVPCAGDGATRMTRTTTGPPRRG